MFFFFFWGFLVFLFFVFSPSLHGLMNKKQYEPCPEDFPKGSRCRGLYILDQSCPTINRRLFRQSFGPKRGGE